MVLAGCVLVGLISAQLPTSPPFTKRLSFRHAAAPVERLIEAVATRFDLPIGVSPSMASDYVVVEVEEVPAIELLERIASVSSGRWRLSEGKYVLTRDNRAAAADEKADRAYRKRVIEESIAKARGAEKELASTQALVERGTELARELAKASPIDDSWMKMRALEAARPGQRLAFRLLAGIDPAEIATILPGQRLVFSDSPNRMQKPLKGASQAIKAWLADRAMWSDARKKMEENPETREWATVLELYAEPMEAPARVLVAVSRGYEWFGLTYGANIMLVWPDGTISRSYATFGRIPDAPDVPQPSASGRNDTFIEFSDMSKRLRAESRSMWMHEDGPPKEPSAEVLELVTQPEKHEPLGFVPSDAVFAVRKKMGGHLVASLPDDLLTALTFADQEQMPTVEQFLRSCDQYDLLEFSKEGDWLMGKPRLVAETRANRGDRAAIGEFVRNAKGKEFLGLEELSSFAKGLKAPPVSGAAGYTLLLALRNRMDFLSFGDYQLLSLYGQLSADQRRTLLGGGRLALGSLTKPQLALVYEMVFGADYRFEVEEPPAKEGEEDAGGKDTIDREPTEALPGGLPSTGYITVAPTEAMLFQTRMESEDGRPMSNLENLDSVAWRAYARQRPDLFAWAATLPREESWRIGTARELAFTIRLTPRHFVRGSVRDNSIPADAPWITPDTAPASIRKKIDELVEKYRKAGDGDDGTDGR